MTIKTVGQLQDFLEDFDSRVPIFLEDPNYGGPENRNGVEMEFVDIPSAHGKYIAVHFPIVEDCEEYD